MMSMMTRVVVHDLSMMTCVVHDLSMMTCVVVHDLS